VTPEGSLLKLVRDYLSAERVWHVRLTQGAAKTSTGSYLKTGNAGMSDILATPWILAGLKPCRYLQLCILWIELKAPNGRQSEAQKRFQAEAEEAGHYYLLINSLDTLIAWLKEHRFKSNMHT